METGGIINGKYDYFSEQVKAAHSHKYWVGNSALNQIS